MTTHQFTVREVVRETPRAVLLRLDTEGARLSFSPGQAALVGLAGRAGRKPYSIASAPEEQRRSGVIEFLVESGPYGVSSTNLAGVGAGSVVDVEGPAGGFVLPRRLPQDLLFIAGGTGIAPLRAMISSALARRHPPSITLLYSARTSLEFAFSAEWQRLSRQGRIRLHRTVTRGVDAAWRGRRGRIQRAWVRACVRGRDPLCFVCGPDAFVVGMMDMLREAGVQSGRIRREQY